LEPEANDALIKELIPLAYVLTPNLHEAKVLTNINIVRIVDAKEAARKIFNMGVKNVIIKGGHLSDSEYAIDLLYDGNKYIEYHARRVKTKNTHGTGCTFASAIAAELAKGSDIKKSVHIAKAYLTAAIQKANTMNIGRGHGPTNHSQNYNVAVDLDVVTIIE
ncbi:MAG: bifunctional hydroxymethylpyrimidine kinase/phosphomethylpyrimidine kinase, partial [Promethearchaeota archaeon]